MDVAEMVKRRVLKNEAEHLQHTPSGESRRRSKSTQQGSQHSSTQGGNMAPLQPCSLFYTLAERDLGVALLSGKCIGCRMRMRFASHLHHPVPPLEQCAGGKSCSPAGNGT